MISENLKKRTIKEDQRELLAEQEYYKYVEEDEDDDDLPYKGKVYLARKKKDDTWICIALQVFIVIGMLCLMYYAYFHFEHMHVSVVHGYAHLGFDTAQHDLGNRYLHGVGVEKHPEKAMEWFKKAAEQGHPAASYNLALGQLKGLHSHIDETEAKRLIKHAADNNVHEAKETLEMLCNRGGCEN